MNKKNRIMIVKEKLEKMKLDALLVTDMKNIRYLTNFTGSSGFLFITMGKPIFITDFRYKTQAEEEVIGFELRIGKENIPESAAKLVKEFGLKTLGFEAHVMSVDLYRKISEKLDSVELKPTTDFIEGLRILKEEEEIASIRAAIDIAEEAFNAILKILKPCMAEKDIAIALEYEIRKRGSGLIPFDIIVASGERAALPHAVSSDRILENGDCIIIDWGAQADGYYSDISRTVFLGEKDGSVKERVYEVVLDAQKKAILEVKPGVTFSELDAVARNFIDDAGYGEYFGHALGHGVGLSVHEAPHISWRGEGVLEQGMVFTVEPGVYIPGVGGVRIEDMVLVKDEGTEVLTHLPKELLFV